jgi:hypothetical protein
MTPAQVRRRYRTIERNQTKWDQAERDLQSICTHPNATKKYSSNTGNWDRGQDSYWIDWHCLDCDKRWSTDQ